MFGSLAEEVDMGVDVVLGPVTVSLPPFRL
jgi:hypothetical protein